MKEFLRELWRNLWGLSPKPGKGGHKLDTVISVSDLPVPDGPAPGAVPLPKNEDEGK